MPNNFKIIGAFSEMVVAAELEGAPLLFDLDSVQNHEICLTLRFS